MLFETQVGFRVQGLACFLGHRLGLGFRVWLRFRRFCELGLRG